MHCLKVYVLGFCTFSIRLIKIKFSPVFTSKPISCRVPLQYSKNLELRVTDIYVQQYIAIIIMSYKFVFEMNIVAIYLHLLFIAKLSYLFLHQLSWPWLEHGV